MMGGVTDQQTRVATATPVARGAGGRAPADRTSRSDAHDSDRSDERGAGLHDRGDDLGESGDGGEPAPPDPGTGGPGGRPRRRIDRTLLLASLVVAVGLALVVRGVLVGITGDDRANLPELVEQVVPVPDAVQVLSQSNVFVDLAPDHTGVLVIDGVEIPTVAVDEIGSVAIEPGQQVDVPAVTIYEPGNATLTFTPSADAPIEEFVDGVHEVQVIYWRIDQGRQRARSYTWTFTVV